MYGFATNSDVRNWQRINVIFQQWHNVSYHHWSNVIFQPYANVRFHCSPNVAATWNSDVGVWVNLYMDLQQILTSQFDRESTSYSNSDTTLAITIEPTSYSNHAPTLGFTVHPTLQQRETLTLEFGSIYIWICNKFWRHKMTVNQRHIPRATQR